MKTTTIYTIFLLYLLMAGCSKPADDIKKEDEENSKTVVEYTQSWTVPSGKHILPIADNHQSDLLDVYRFGNKTFHFYHIFTNYQHQYYLARFENEKWHSVHYSPNRMLFAASDSKIGEIVHSSPNSQQDIISTRFFDPDTESFSVFTTQTFTTKFRLVAIAATHAGFYMIAKRQTEGSWLLYRWNTASEEWEVQMENIPGADEWNTTNYDIFRRKDGAFTYKNWNSTGLNFYAFKDNAFTRIYRGGYDDIILAQGARLHVVNNTNLLVFDKVYRVANDNTLTEYYAPPENRHILQSSADGDKLILTLGTHSWAGTTFVHQIVVINYSTGKVYELPAQVDYDNYDWNMTNRYDVDKWQFRVNSDNKIEGLVHFEYNSSMGRIPKLYRVVYPEVLK